MFIIHTKKSLYINRVIIYGAFHEKQNQQKIKKTEKNSLTFTQCNEILYISILLRYTFPGNFVDWTVTFYKYCKGF